MADELRRAIYDWIRDDLGTAAKLTISAKQVEALLARIKTRAAPPPEPSEAEVEAVARAICLQDCKRFEIGLGACNPGVTGECHANYAQLYAAVCKARAAIAALRAAKEKDNG